MVLQGVFSLGLVVLAGLCFRVCGCLKSLRLDAAMWTLLLMGGMALGLLLMILLGGCTPLF